MHEGNSDNNNSFEDSKGQIKREWWNASGNGEYKFVCIWICESSDVTILHKQIKKEVNV